MALIIRVSSFLNLKTPMNLVSSKVYRVITGQLLSGKQFLGVAHSPARKAGHAPIAVSMEREAAFPFSWRSHRYGKAATAKLKRTSFIWPAPGPGKDQGIPPRGCAQKARRKQEHWQRACPTFRGDRKQLNLSPRGAHHEIIQGQLAYVKSPTLPS